MIMMGLLTFETLWICMPMTFNTSRRYRNITRKYRSHWQWMERFCIPINNRYSSWLFWTLLLQYSAGGGENNCQNFCIWKNWKTCLSGLLPSLHWAKHHFGEKLIVANPNYWSTFYIFEDSISKSKPIQWWFDADISWLWSSQWERGFYWALRLYLWGAIS